MFRWVSTILGLALGLALGFSGCGYPGWMAASGPNRAQINKADESERLEGIELVDVTDSVANALAARKKNWQFAQKFPASSHQELLINPGDNLEIVIWESPPPTLFSPSGPFKSAMEQTGAQAVTLPVQTVSTNGKIRIPFVGQLTVAGLSIFLAEKIIADSLQGKANQAQVMVRQTQNKGSQVTVLGDVNTSLRMPLSPQGERVLDAVATAGGSKQDVTRTSVKLSRQGETVTMPLNAIIDDPLQNIRLMPGDVVTVMYQPNSFSVLGATGKNDEIPFEAKGISLAQALARAGGTIDNRADSRAVYVFRFEDPEAAPVSPLARQTADHKVPVIYQINLRDPAALFIAQNFPMENGDVLYVATAPSAEFQKFLNMLFSVVLPAMSINNNFN